MRMLRPLVPAVLSLALALPAFANPPPAAPAAQVDPLAKKITGSDAYIPTFGLRATVSRGFNLHGFIAVDAGLDVPKPETRRRVEAIKPRLMSEMRDALAGYASLSYIIGERPDADMLRVRLQRAVDNVLGRGEARVALASVIVFPR
jgi:hypothetical protein